MQQVPLYSGTECANAEKYISISAFLSCFTPSLPAVLGMEVSASLATWSGIFWSLFFRFCHCSGNILKTVTISSSDSYDAGKREPEKFAVLPVPLRGVVIPLTGFYQK